MEKLISIEVTGLSPSVSGFCTTRHGGVSQGTYAWLNLGDHVGDAPDCVRENRRLLRERLPSDPFWLEQVHGNRVIVVDADVTNVRPRADALVTTQKNRVLPVLIADCLPIVLADDSGRVLGVAHAGWRGLAGGVLQQTLSAMREQVSQLGPWRAWVGPGIGATAFEVGPDVVQAFVAVDPVLKRHFIRDPNRDQKWYCDLAGLARQLLMAMGAEDVSLSGCCTFSDPQERFFSYRRDGQTGRMATVVWLSSN